MNKVKKRNRTYKEWFNVTATMEGVKTDPIIAVHAYKMGLLVQNFVGVMQPV